MKEYPILYSTDMVKAILDGRKTQTRRTNGLSFLNLVGRDQADKPTRPDQYKFHDFTDGVATFIRFSARIDRINVGVAYHVKCPYGQVGDHLWIRETWAGQDFAVCCENDKPNYKGKDGYSHPVIHKAGKENYAWGMSGEPKWHSGRFMFKTSARLWQEITDITAQRLQEITEADAQAEGMLHPSAYRDPLSFYDGRDFIDAKTYRDMYIGKWQELNRKTHPFASNPWVWVITSKLIDKKDMESDQ